ncbi:hypothetical protein C8R45DRAFT_990147 [Mycena sanguinolenta]|nr:hypothetical protein C8R45DRAFT_990147 [Mycena sanguinolenta]
MIQCKSRDDNRLPLPLALPLFLLLLRLLPLPLLTQLLFNRRAVRRVIVLPLQILQIARIYFPQHRRRQLR